MGPCPQQVMPCSGLPVDSLLHREEELHHTQEEMGDFTPTAYKGDSEIPHADENSFKVHTLLVALGLPAAAIPHTEGG